MKKKWLYSFFFLSSLSLEMFSFFPLGEAYIPSYSMILSHLADAQGKGGYLIEQEVVFKEGAEPLFLKEIWWIASSQEMRLDVVSAKKTLKKKDIQAGGSSKLYLRFLYKGGKKIFRDENSRLQRHPLSPYHLEKPFHLRSEEKLRKLFSLWRVAPYEAPERKEGQGSDSFTRLSRKGGVIQYQIGKGLSHVWVEQDEFVIRSWKWASGESLSAGAYVLYPGSLFYPSFKVFRQNAMEVGMQTQKVKRWKGNKKQMRIKILSKKNTLPDHLSSVEQDRIREFYAKFR
ncbi:MAG: hypothetical protein OXM55_05870 [Bdellovibrionales bacterium]|nr:hypothetical protein [Bdellovibrionales bacterium]